jgi:hypothetical protein
MFAQGVLVLDDPVQAAIQSILLGHLELALEQFVHRGVHEPPAMHRELAPRRAQPVDGKQLQHLLPRHASALVAQLLPPEQVQPQLAPQTTSQPAVAETARTQQADVAHDQRQRVDLVGRNRSIVGK